jgi:hypothetical protein
VGYPVTDVPTAILQDFRITSAGFRSAFRTRNIAQSYTGMRRAYRAVVKHAGREPTDEGQCGQQPSPGGHETC